jgi:plasmid stabilization system protein ParE
VLVELSDSAERDLLGICEFLGPSQAGERLVADFERQLANLRSFPSMGLPSHPLARGDRAVLLGDYVMTYTIREDRVVIRRIVHGARDPERR